LGKPEPTFLYEKIGLLFTFPTFEEKIDQEFFEDCRDMPGNFLR